MKKITFIGCGKMGAAAIEKLLEGGFPITVYNRSREKALPLEKKGAKVADSLEAAVTDADVVFTSVLDDLALNEITQAMLPYCKKGAIHISTSTILPRTATELEKKHQEQGIVYLAAPIAGIPKALRAKKAMSFCSGDHDAFKKVTPLLETYCDGVEYLGENVSHANIFKVCINYSLISAIELISELYAYAEKSGLDKEIIVGFLKHVYGHPGYHGYIDKIHARNFDDVNFDMKGGNKDVNLFRQAFSEVGVVPDIGNMLSGKFIQALANGMGNKDWSAIGEVVRERAGLK